MHVLREETATAIGDDRELHHSQTIPNHHREPPSGGASGKPNACLSHGFLGSVLRLCAGVSQESFSPSLFSHLRQVKGRGRNNEGAPTPRCSSLRICHVIWWVVSMMQGQGQEGDNVMRAGPLIASLCTPAPTLWENGALW